MKKTTIDCACGRRHTVEQPVASRDAVASFKLGALAIALQQAVTAAENALLSPTAGAVQEEIAGWKQVLSICGSDPLTITRVDVNKACEARHNVRVMQGAHHGAWGEMPPYKQAQQRNAMRAALAIFGIQES